MNMSGDTRRRIVAVDI